MVLNESIQLEREIENASTISKNITGNSPHIFRTYENMILHIGVTQESMKIIDPNDTMNPTDIIRAISETARNQLVASKNMSQEAQTDSETTHAIVLNAHTHQVVLA